MVFMAADSLSIVDAFDDVQALLRASDQAPLSMAAIYMHMAGRLDVDFEASIRLLDKLPVFLHGEAHKHIRKQMATRMAEQRNKHESIARAYVDKLDQQVHSNQPFEVISGWLHPLWRHMNGMDSPADDDLFHFIAIAPQLFNMAATLRTRLQINAWIERFIALDASTADERLLHLGQNVLGFTPLVATLAMSLHQLLVSHTHQLLADIDYPAIYPNSAVQTTDRYRTSCTEGKEIARCVLHSRHRTTEQNNATLYGVGEHVFLGRPLANSLWAMLTHKLSRMPHRVMASIITMERPAPVTDEDYLQIQEPFQRPTSLWITLSA